MAHYRASIDTQQPRGEVFAYLSDFSTTKEWDPGVVEAERLNGAAVGEGTEFRLVAVFLGRKNELTYRIVEYDPPRAVTFLGENATVIGPDHVRTNRRGHTSHLRRRPRLEGAVQDRRPATGARVQPRRRSRSRRSATNTRPGAAATLIPLPGRALDAKAYELPGDLEKQHDFLVVALRRERRRLVDGWLAWLATRATSTTTRPIGWPQCSRDTI